MSSGEDRTAKQRHRDRMTMPGQGPTAEDLRLNAALSRQELADTVEALSNRTRKMVLLATTAVLGVVVLWRVRSLLRQ